MKNVLLFIISFSLVTLLTAQNEAYTRANLEEEMAMITKGMEIYHPNAYHYVDSMEMATYRKEVLATVPEQLTALEAYRELNKYVCLFNDGHTRLWDYHLGKAYKANDGRYLPFSVKVTSEQLIIKKDYETDGVLEGHQIESINGINAKELIAEMVLHASRETTTLDYTLLSNNFGRYLWLTYGWESNFSVTTTDPSGAAKTATYTGVTIAQKVAAQPKAEKRPAVSYRMIDNDVAYLQITHFEGRPKAFHKKFEEAFAFFHESGAQQLIIDARNHGGGDSRIGKDLARYFADAPFKQFAYSEWKATPQFKENFKAIFLPKSVHWAVPVLKGLNPHFKAIYSAEDHANARVEYKPVKPYRGKRAFTGEVFLLMDKNTFSAGTCFAAIVKDYNMATIIGQESGNLANFHADGLIRFNLPVSGLHLQVSTSYLVRPNGDESQTPVQPDVKLAENIDALEYALQLSKK